MLNFRQRTWHVPSLPVVQETLEGTPAYYNPLSELRPQTHGLVAARVQCFEFGVIHPSCSISGNSSSHHSTSSSDLHGVTQGSKSQAQRRKKTEFQGDANIPLDLFSQLSCSTTTNTSTGTDRWKNRATSRFSVLFSSNSNNGCVGKECERVEELQSKLHSYTLFGLPKMPQQLSFDRDSWEEEPNLEMEESWKEILEKPETLTKRQCQQQEAIWELLETESAYIKKLYVITDLFLSGLLNLQESGLLCDINPAHLFGNIQEIVHLHTLFWSEVLLPALERSRQSRSMLDPADLHQGFSTFNYRFKPYIRYCMEGESCMEYMRTLLKDNELFRIYVTWAETHKQCSRLKLTDMLVKPHQRLTKYPLLLKSILKQTDEQFARDAVSTMVVAVENFINSVDSQMRQREAQQKLEAVASRIEVYEPVEGVSEEVEKILRDYNHFDLTAPVLSASTEQTRQLYLEGALRMKEGRDNKMDVHCFLFTDVLLITKQVKRVDKFKVIRQPLVIRNMVCRDLKDPAAFLLIYLNEFRSAVASYHFQANSATQGSSWVEAIYNAQNQIKRIRSVSWRDERNEDEEDELQSSMSTSTFPSLQHKENLHKSLLNSSTETLALVPLEPNEIKRPSLQSRLSSESSNKHSANDHQVLERHPESRSPSVDSAYGTLSPESLTVELDMKAGMQQRVGEGTDTGEEETFEEDDKTDVDDDASEENSIAWNGSQVSVNESSFLGDDYNLQKKQMEHLHLMPLCSKVRRHSPIHPGTCYFENVTLRSHSEDNLLQQLDSPLHHCMSSKHSISKSLTQLMDSREHPQGETAQHHHDNKGLSDKVADTLMRAEGRIFHRTMSSFSDQNVRRCDTEASQQLHLHRKLTKAQLQKMRSTMVLNSTLTASEV